MTQQTIRVPIGYPLPGMQLHVVTGNANQQYAQYAAVRQQSQMNATRSGYGYTHEKPPVKYTERGVPEGAASVPQNDCNTLITTSTAGTQGSSNNTQTSTTANTAQSAVFYAMNV